MRLRAAAATSGGRVELPELVGAPVDVLDECLLRSEAVAGLDRRQDALVLGDHLRQHLGRAGRPQPRDADELAQLPEEALEQRQSRSVGDSEVELLVEVDEVVLAALGGLIRIRCLSRKLSRSECRRGESGQ